MSAQFIRLAVALVVRGDAGNNRAAKQLFGFSIVFLFVLFAVLLLETIAFRLIEVL